MFSFLLPSTSCLLHRKELLLGLLRTWLRQKLFFRTKKNYILNHSFICFWLCCLFKIIHSFIYSLWLCWVFMLHVGFLWLQSMDFCCSGFSSLRAPALVSMGSVVKAHRLSCFMTCGMFQDQGSNYFPCTGRQILNHCTTREVPPHLFIGFHIQVLHPL